MRMGILIVTRGPHGLEAYKFPSSAQHLLFYFPQVVRHERTKKICSMLLVLEVFCNTDFLNSLDKALQRHRSQALRGEHKVMANCEDVQ